MFKVLALDGGGIKGTYTAAVLDQIQKSLPKNRNITEYFDLIVGTSTGGIIALGLANGQATAEVLKIYVESGSQIFPDVKRGPAGIFEWMFESKFDPEPLKRNLKNIFGNKKFCDSFENVAVTSLAAANAKPFIFQSGYGKSKLFEDIEIVDVALATSAAPTYFPASSVGKTYMIDGGVWANCPAMVGLTEAVSSFKKPLKEVRVLSIGTTTEPRSIHEKLL